MARREGEADNTVERLRVAAVQMKFAPSIEENLAAIDRLSGEARRRRADAVLFPECAVAGYGYDFATLRRGQVRDALAAVGEMARRLDINLL